MLMPSLRKRTRCSIFLEPTRSGVTPPYGFQRAKAVTLPLSGWLRIQAVVACCRKFRAAGWQL